MSGRTADVRNAILEAMRGSERPIRLRNLVTLVYGRDDPDKLLANSLKVTTMRSGAPSTVSEATEPANMPASKPRSSAMRAEIASKTEAGRMQR